jgi:cytochrome c oxidase subunit II
MLLGGCALDGVMEPRGANAASIARLWWFMFWLGAAVFVGWFAFFLGAMFRRRRREADEEGERRAQTLFIIGGGIVMPAIVLGSLFVANLVGLTSLPRGREVVIDATAYQFWWEFAYPDPGFVTANEMYVPTGTDVRIRMSSPDVIHSFWVPQLAGKLDLVPGHLNELTLNASEPGRYLGECAEYCGIQHANMRFAVVAVPPEEYESWLRMMAAPSPPPNTPSEIAGFDAFMANCAGCHAIRGTPADGRKGPDLSRFALRRELGAGVAPNDPGHLGGWIVNSQALKPGNPMPPVPVDPRSLNDLLTYLESLE